MKIERLRQCINMFMATDRSQNPMVLVLCFNAMAAQSLCGKARTILRSEDMADDAFEVVETGPGLVFKGGGMLVFSEDVRHSGHEFTKVWFDDRIIEIIERAEIAKAKVVEGVSISKGKLNTKPSAGKGGKTKFAKAHGTAVGGSSA